MFFNCCRFYNRYAADAISVPDRLNVTICHICRFSFFHFPMPEIADLCVSLQGCEYMEKMLKKIFAILPVAMLVAACGKHAPENRMVLPTPSGLTMSLYDPTSLLITWEPVEEAAHYNIVLEGADGTSAGETAQVEETSVLIRNVEDGKSYRCRVRAVNGYDYSDFAISNTVDVPAVEEPEPEM